MDYAIETYGCALNQADSEILAGLLEAAGWRQSDKPDVRVINTCTVKTPTDRKILRRLNELTSNGGAVIVTGCLPAADPKISFRFPDFSFIGTNVSDIVEAADSAISGERFVQISTGGSKLCSPRHRGNPHVGIIPIAEGCMGACSYCITSVARGGLTSHTVKDVITEVEQGVSEGIREFWITAQDTGAYALDCGSNLSELLHKIVDVEGDFKIRIGMMNPDHLLSFLAEIIDVYASPKIYKFIHIPVQSGNDRVLGEMGRKYTSDDFKRIVDVLREKIPQITISTDVICGFPTESEKEFDDTLNMISDIKPDVLNISRFWSRPQTRAALMACHPGRVTKDRSRRMSNLFEKVGLERNQQWIGWEGKSYVSQQNADGTFTARNHTYKPIIIKSSEDLLGTEVNIKIRQCTYYDLRGELI